MGRTAGWIWLVRELRGRSPARRREKLELAGLEIDVLFTPGHSAGHLTYSIPAHEALLVGDVLFAGSVVAPTCPAATA